MPLTARRSLLVTGRSLIVMVQMVFSATGIICVLKKNLFSLNEVEMVEIAHGAAFWLSEKHSWLY